MPAGTEKGGEGDGLVVPEGEIEARGRPLEAESVSHGVVDLICVAGGYALLDPADVRAVLLWRHVETGFVDGERRFRPPFRNGRRKGRGKHSRFMVEEDRAPEEPEPEKGCVSAAPRCE